ncbi:MAG: hypothetical protein COV74_02540 [Candidatus Omnitrophica bacterium CG11_big_fil_rev_8_21_14_0_20_45_26]|uniref:Cytochrome c domain-containing protein n=1 Tax=Candidatus Abzuiibacterium crystallinum TaxID=1974748 RepID=A0A2H0LRQ1_9BACT|nr:MAG: hypothetical protein COV74_02540 [Candidatus Omnitrophica bacterium CG11_big_fil_rev_8_21_14_0_20_45_26]PIW65714.1 MAG: hypothetical protein COW12_00385 [Candidatus Omnitrophica bacterium CG12_big_fil_rev_8_21_14_0_65_45_16]
MPPSKNDNKLYSVEKTTFWFAIASVGLLVTLLLMLFQDHDREWKYYQREFVKLEREKTQEKLDEIIKNVNMEQLQRLKEELKEANFDFKQKQDQYNQLVKEKESIQLPLISAKNRYQDLKQYYDSYKFFFEEDNEAGEQKEAKAYQEKLEKTAVSLETAKEEMERLEKKQEDIDQAIRDLEAEQKTLTDKISAKLRDQERYQKKLEKLKPSVVKELLNAPMLDFMVPTLQIQQIVLEDLNDDFFFAKSNKIDRCTTCHLAIDQEGFEDAPQPFRTHPSLDLFLASNSPHPLEKIGCTVCHSGSGQSLSFTWAAHTPRDEVQAEEWKKEYHWHELEKWEAKMLPLQFTEASCTKCHQGVVDIPEAPKINHGRQLAREFGCFACHTVKGFSAEGGSASGGEGAWKVGPSLLNVKSKVDSDWMIRWLQAPKKFRASTRMPSVFHLENTSDQESKTLSNAGIKGISRYLMIHSGEVPLQSPPPKGNPETGQALIKEIGCLGCHSAEGVHVNDRGPELTGLGSKVSADWLYTWLKDPKHYSPETPMPNLRLSNQQAADITAYLLQDRNEAFESTGIPEVKEADVDQLAMSFLIGRMRESEAEETLSAMDADAKLQFVGKEMINRQGCFGCHDIQGFENAKRIGTELTKEGQKEITKLDFGFVEIPHSRQAWFFQKLKHPRSYDKGRVKPYQDKLRMPDFGLTDEQAEALTTFLLSLRTEDIPLEMQRQLNLDEQAIEAGRFLVNKYNCQGCHTLDGVEGRVRSLFEDLGNAPPVLDGEGAKVQEDWLFEFLHAPSTIRPWLKYHMPGFGLSEDELNALIQYFALLEHQKVSFAPSDISTDQDILTAGRQLFMQFKCIQCHQSAESPGLTASFLAPDLVISKDRLKPQWVVEWLKEPQRLQEGTMMPTFFADGTTPIADVLDGDWIKQIHALRDYMWQLTEEQAEAIKSANLAAKTN